MKEVRHEQHLTHIPAFWDTLIVLLLCAGLGSAAFFLWLAAHPADPAFIRIFPGLLGILGLLGFSLTVWGSFIEPHLITLNKKSIHIKGLPDVTIAVIADLHVGPYKGRRYVERIVAKANALQADLIVLPGDFIYDSTADLSALEPLQHLHARLGVFAVLGNHDTGHMLLRSKRKYISYRTPDRSADIIRMLEKLGIAVLRNNHRMFGTGGSRFALAGTDHCWMDSCDIHAAYKDIAANVPVILLSHIPDAIMDTDTLRASLIISGHTHGGQVRLPFVGSLGPIPDQLGRTFDQGLFRLQNGAILAISHGIGETMARARLFCPPEILVLRITST
jgi:uncharacterized protein